MIRRHAGWLLAALTAGCRLHFDDGGSDAAAPADGQVVDGAVAIDAPAPAPLFCDTPQRLTGVGDAAADPDLTATASGVVTVWRRRDGAAVGAATTITGAVPASRRSPDR